jgi:Phage ABA sandwich domain
MKSWKKELLKKWWNENLDYFPLGAKFRGRWQKNNTAWIIKELDKRKLDIEVAQKVFGYEIAVGEYTEYHDYGGQTEYPELQYVKEVHKNGSWDGTDWKEWEALPHYSTDIKDAFSIVNKFAEDGFYCSVELGTDLNDPENFYAHFYYGDSNGPHKPGTKMGQGWASTTPLAICTAALEVKLLNET